ncbi:MAG: hypothetical protein MI974_27425 [Chitinophagales bacterium]|nr:hypothetical protein [Chitinophagales bacterium]
MTISDNKTIRDIQREFNQKFSALKIEFYASHHESGEGSPVKEQLAPEQLLKNARTKHSEDDFIISPEMSVGDFEQTFYDLFGLNVQVFRKSGNLWMQTTSTDSWSLEQQNRKGGSSERHYKDKYE